MKIALTGATGYIGQQFIQQAHKQHSILALSRHAPLHTTCEWIPYDLNATETVTLPPEVDVVLHLAVSQTSNHENLVNSIDIAAAERLLAASQQIGARFIFVSSQTARENAPTMYGRSKWHIEQKVLAAGGIIIRPGQVYGGEACGLFGKLVDLVQKLPVLPAFLPAPHIQPIHVDDLNSGILRIIEHWQSLPSKVFCLGSIQSIAFHHFLAAIAQHRLHRRRLFIPVPVALIRLAESIVGRRATLQQLLSLFDLPIMDTQADLQLLRLNLRSLAEGLLNGN